MLLDTDFLIWCIRGEPNALAWLDERKIFMPKNIFKEGKKYTFSDYFEMGHPTEEIVTAFGYTLVSQLLPLPRNNQFDLAVLENLKNSYYALTRKA